MYTGIYNKMLINLLYETLWANFFSIKFNISRIDVANNVSSKNFVFFCDLNCVMFAS